MSTTSDKLRLLILTMVAVVLVIVFSPFNRFFNPALKDLGPMSIGGLIMEEPLTAADVRNKPCLGVFGQNRPTLLPGGKIIRSHCSGGIRAWENSGKDREDWQKIYYLYVIGSRFFVDSL